MAHRLRQSANVAGARKHSMRVTLRRLKIGEQIKVGDWCWPEGGTPTAVIMEWNEVRMTKTHYPHWRVEFPKP